MPDRARFVLPWLSLLALASCADLQTLTRNVCGNGIIERGEDCDGIGIDQNTCNAACRLECTAAGTCPAGWGCGNDGLCRQPTGAFAAFGATLAVAADQLTLADFDGDGRSDVLATRGTTFTIAFLDPSGLQAKTSSVSFAPSDTHLDVPAAGDLDSPPDGRADLAFRLRDGLSVMRGQTDRTLSANAYSGSLDKPVEAGDVLVSGNFDRDPSALGDEVLAMREDGLYLVHTTDQADLPTGTGQLFAFPAGHGKASGRIATGQLVTATPVPPSTTEYVGTDIVFAFDGDDHVTVFKPRLTSYDATTGKSAYAWNYLGALAAPVTVALPAGATVKGGAFVASSRLALGGAAETAIFIAGQDSQAAPALFVTYSLATGFTSAPTASPVVADNKAGPFTRLGGAAPSDPHLGDPPLALADLNGDGFVDLVSPFGVYLSNCNSVTTASLCTATSMSYLIAAQPDGASGWTDAIAVPEQETSGGYTVGDLILAGGDPGLTYLRGPVGEPGFVTFATFRVPTQSPVQNLTVGDFDGDGAADVAFSQVSSRVPGAQSLQIAFGSALGIPTAPVDLGDVGTVGQIVSGTIAEPSTYHDGVSDLLVTGTAAGTAELFRFDGSTDRQIQSALQLYAPCDPTATGAAPIGTPRSAAIGPFTTIAAQDLTVLYQTAAGGYELWALSPGSSDSASICAGKIGPGVLPTPGSDELSILPVDLNGDGIDEVLVLPSGAGKLFIGRIGAGNAWTIDTITLAAPYTGIATGNLGARPAGAKALRDVILWSDTEVAVLWNDGTGTLSPTTAATLPVAATTCAGATVGAPLGVTVLDLAATPQREILIVTATATLLAEIADPTQRTFAPLACKSDVFGPGGQAITSGDVNGDGVDDVVIAQPGGISVLTGTPVVQ